MKVQPLKRYSVPRYPTIEEASRQPELLARVPRRWAAQPHFAALLGAGLMTKVLVATAEGAAPVRGRDAMVQRVPAQPKASPTAATDAAQRVQQATTVVAPLLADALAHDGRGSFGCMAVNPPTFLSEDEAVELIRHDLEAAGLKLEEDVVLDKIEAPVSSRGNGTAINIGAPVSSSITGIDIDELEEGSRTVSRSTRKEPVLGETEFEFDLADRQRGVYIEYLSRRDYQEWVGPSMSTAQSYDFPTLAKRVTASFEKRKADAPAVVGVFFDPLAHAEVPYPDTRGLDRKQASMVYEQYREATTKARAHLADKAREKLREQVQGFVSFLRQKKLLSAAASGAK